MIAHAFRTRLACLVCIIITISPLRMCCCCCLLQIVEWGIGLVGLSFKLVEIINIRLPHRRPHVLFFFPDPLRIDPAQGEKIGPITTTWSKRLRRGVGLLINSSSEPWPWYWAAADCLAAVC